MGHHGEPAEEEEVIVIEEPERPEGVEPKVLRAPRVPTQEERDAHKAIQYRMRIGARSVWQPGAAIRPIKRERRPQGRRRTVISLVHRRTRMTP